MKRNLFIGYDLSAPGQNYDAVTERIESPGLFHKFQQSLYRVSTTATPDEAYLFVR